MEKAEILQWISDLTRPESRENALLELSTRRDDVPHLAPMLWRSHNAVASLLHEIITAYSTLNPPTLTPHQSRSVCNALSLMQCLASHQETCTYFLAAKLPLYLFPFLHTASRAFPFEALRVATLGVFAAWIMTGEQEVIKFLLSTETIPVCLRIMESDRELARAVASFILQKIVLDKTGLAYICQTYERFALVAVTLDKMVLSLAQEQSPSLLKNVIRCYLILSYNLSAREVLLQCLPQQLRDDTFASCLEDNRYISDLLAELLTSLEAAPDADSQLGYEGSIPGSFGQSWQTDLTRAPLETVRERAFAACVCTYPHSIYFSHESSSDLTALWQLCGGSVATDI